ncbi:hypothetical protein TRVL_06694 [Trypanosoma vivax]|nr:hypothetical protein TRVL_06694 [Trypanosoma vivax]
MFSCSFLSRATRFALGKPLECHWDTCMGTRIVPGDPPISFKRRLVSDAPRLHEHRKRVASHTVCGEHNCANTSLQQPSVPGPSEFFPNGQSACALAPPDRSKEAGDTLTLAASPRWHSHPLWAPHAAERRCRSPIALH